MYERTIVEESARNIAVMDVFSKLVQKRIVFIDDDITDELANGVIAQLLYLDSVSHDTINVYINTQGGSVYAGLAIYDIAQLIKSPIRTVSMGIAASMGAILILMGKERVATKHCRIMLHQPSGGAVGTADEISVANEEIQRAKQDIYRIVEAKTSLKNVEQLFRLDTWYTSEEAHDCGLLTGIL